MVYVPSMCANNFYPGLPFCIVFRRWLKTAPESAGWWWPLSLLSVTRQATPPPCHPLITCPRTWLTTHILSIILTRLTTHLWLDLEIYHHSFSLSIIFLRPSTGSKVSGLALLSGAVDVVDLSVSEHLSFLYKEHSLKGSTWHESHGKRPVSFLELCLGQIILCFPTLSLISHNFGPHRTKWDSHFVFRKVSVIRCGSYEQIFMCEWLGARLAHLFIDTYFLMLQQ